MNVEERAIYIGLVLICVPVVVVQVARGSDLSMVALGLALLGIVGLVRSWLRAPDLPMARIHRR